MNTSAETLLNLEPEPAVACDWVEAYGDYLYNFAVGQVHDSSIAEDLVQETFLGALKARDRFAGKSAERTWLIGILRHKIYDYLRKTCRERSRRVQITSDHDDEASDSTMLWLHDVAVECQSPSRRIELQEFRSHLETALGELPERIAAVFQLYEIEERPNAEVCQALNISEGNLWVMLHRARKQLREQLRGWWHGDNTGASSASEKN